MSEMNAAIAGLQNPSLHPSLGDEIVGRINRLGAISETPEHLARVFLSKEHRAAADLILAWMREAGMQAHLDAIGNVCVRHGARGRQMGRSAWTDHGDFLRGRSA